MHDGLQYLSRAVVITDLRCFRARFIAFAVAAIDDFAAVDEV